MCARIPTVTREEPSRIRWFAGKNNRPAAGSIMLLRLTDSVMVPAASRSRNVRSVFARDGDGLQSGPLVSDIARYLRYQSHSLANSAATSQTLSLLPEAAAS